MTDRPHKLFSISSPSCCSSASLEPNLLWGCCRDKQCFTLTMFETRSQRQSKTSQEKTAGGSATSVEKVHSQESEGGWQDAFQDAFQEFKNERHAQIRRRETRKQGFLQSQDKLLLMNGKKIIKLLVLVMQRRRRRPAGKCWCRFRRHKNLITILRSLSSPNSRLQGILSWRCLFGHLHFRYILILSDSFFLYSLHNQETIIKGIITIIHNIFFHYRSRFFCTFLRRENYAASQFHDHWRAAYFQRGMNEWQWFSLEKE